MANPIPLSELRAIVREDTDTENDDHIPLTFVDRNINRGIRVYFAALLESDPDRLLATTTINTTAGTTEYALPADFHSIRGLDFVSGGEEYTLRSFNFEERNRRSNQAIAGTSDFPRYRVARSGTDGSAERLLFDIDPGTNTYTLHYLRGPTTLVNPTDAVDDVLGFSEFVTAFAKDKVRARNEEDNMSERADMAESKVTIQSQAKHRHVDGFEKAPRTRRRRHALRW